MPVNLLGRSVLKLMDFTPDEIRFLLRLSASLKQAKYGGYEQQRLKGRNIALIFEKDSTRTRTGFEVAAYDQGAHVTYLGPTGTQIGKKESMKDTARVLGRVYDAIEYRGFGQSQAEQLARWSGATVVATVSSEEKAALAVAAGAHHVVNYRVADVAEEVRALCPGGVDIAVEVAPAQNVAVDLDLVKVHGLVSIYANNGGDEMTMPLRAAFGKNLRFQFLILYTLDPGLVRAAVEDVNAAITDGALRVGEEAGLPLHHCPLEQAAAAHDAVEHGAVGKVLLDIADA